eukprot:gb/GECH01012106.1/.p1 GENE.gb/GECH01012106.1/~~gb/GECH01012106.1/.p1  ORF type:complete len:394 (+),score=86.82 gb/GECH01012106.1/:1-1182(+)
MGKKSKKPEVEETPVLGRFGSNLSMGIVGLPNVGKSSLFNQLTKSSIPAENFPFCTIDPNTARVPIPDERFNWLCKHFQPASEVPAYLTVTDIAGLVRGASEGQGLGNAFLSHIKAVDGIFHVLRVFKDPEITHVEDSIDPVRDLEIISDELRAKDLEAVQAQYDKVENIIERGIDKTRKSEFETLKKLLAHVKEGKDVRDGDWKSADIPHINSLQLLTAKPVVYLVNLSEKDYIRKKNRWLPKIKEWVDNHSKGPLIPFSASLETTLFNMPDDEAEKYLKEKNTTSAINKIVTTGYKGLHLIHYFTCGTDEVKCWTIREGTRAPQAAGKIHTDFERGFIGAEVIKFEDLKEHESESAVKSAGKCNLQGKTYVVQDGDIIFFKFNVSGGGKKK